MIIEMPVPSDFSFLETLSAHGWRRLLPFAWHEETQILERVEELDDSRVRLLRLFEVNASVQVEVEDAGEEAEITRRVRRMLQLDLPLAVCIAGANVADISLLT